jgi:thiamine monophosphate synthase
LVDGDSSYETFANKAKTLVASGVHVIQLRDKLLPDAELWKRATVLKELTSLKPTKLIINDRPDIRRGVGKHDDG